MVRKKMALYSAAAPGTASRPGTKPDKVQQELQMTFRKIPLTLLILTMSVACAHAKKEPKYEQARQLTADQAALVQRAVAQEKVLIKSIELRTPLVETYIQDTRPDVKLYEVPTDDQYMLSRVDFS
jgi:hypothetical protein